MLGTLISRIGPASLLGALALLAFSCVHADDAVPSKGCYDAVVVAKLVEQGEGSLIRSGSLDDFLPRSSWVLTFEPQQVLYAKVPPPKWRIKVRAVAHAALNDRIPYFLIFLRYEQQQFRLQWFDTDVMRGADGHFVVPFGEGHSIETFPTFWIPPDYATRQVPLRIRTRNIWWLRDEYDDDGNLIPLSTKPKWTELNGLRLNDLRPVFEQQATQSCEHSQYRAS